MARRPAGRDRLRLETERAVNAELEKNKFEHLYISLPSGASRSIQAPDVVKFLEGFTVEKVLNDYKGWYATFDGPEMARKAARVVGSTRRTVGNHSVVVAVCQPPGAPKAAASTASPVKDKEDIKDARKYVNAPLTKEELVDMAQMMIVKELGKMVQKDVMERVVGKEVRRLAVEEKARRARGGVRVNGIVKVDDGVEKRDGEKKGLKGLSFKRKKPVVVPEIVKIVPPVEEKVEVAASVKKRKADVEEEDEEDVVARKPPKKKVKKDSPKKTRKIIEDELESEEDQLSMPAPEPVVSNKRAASVELDDDALEPVKKKAKVTKVGKAVKQPAAAKKKGGRPKKVTVVIEQVEQVLPEQLLFEEPAVASVHVTPELESSLSPVISPLTPSSPPPHLLAEAISLAASSYSPVDPRKLGICEDDEDAYFASLYLTQEPATSPSDQSSETLLDTAMRKHLTGSARTEGFYKISHAEKQAYVDQYAHRAIAADPNSTKGVKSAAPSAVNSSRANRSNARHIGKGLEEMNQLLQQKRTGSASHGSNNADLSIKFNQLQTRKKHLRFARSPIHDWGLYAMEKISRGEMVIEYVGEVVRAAVADKREKAYERQGIGSSYLFRIDDDLVVDATKKGNLG